MTADSPKAQNFLSVQNAHCDQEHCWGKMHVFDPVFSVRYLNACGFLENIRVLKPVDLMKYSSKGKSFKAHFWYLSAAFRVDTLQWKIKKESVMFSLSEAVFVL